MNENHKDRYDGLLVLCALLLIWLFPVALHRNSSVVSADRITVEGGPVLIIDPGHGGLDGGASTWDGKPESKYNLQIAMRLRDLSALMGIHTVMTREGEALDYPPELGTIAVKKRWDTQNRTARINAEENGYLISIHQNFYPDERPHGAQVLYAQSEQSRQWGEAAQALFKSCLDGENPRCAVKADRSIYIMSHVHCPAILVECGFLSHPGEAVLLGEHDYQMKLAAILLESFFEIAEESNI